MINALIESITTTLSSLITDPTWVDITDQLDQK